MNTKEKWIAFRIIVAKEVKRFLRIWVQTLIPPAITVVLYFVIFGKLIGPRIGDMGGRDYMQYIVPGLIMMSVITNSYSNVVASFFSSKFQKSVEEMLVSPLSISIIIRGYVMGGVARGISVGAIVTVLALFFTQLTLFNILVTVSIVLLTAILFSLGGFINAVFATKFDDISIVPTFVLTPLTYLGGVFYSIDLLPPFWAMVSKANPIVYMVNGFRYGILGISDVGLIETYGMIILFIVGLYGWALYLMNRGIGIRS